MSNPIKSAAVRVARAERTARREPTNPNLDAVVDARRTLAEAKIAEAIQRAVSAAPPLTDEQRARLARLLAPHTAGAA